MNRDQKAAVIEEIAAQIQAAEAVFAVDYRGISVPQAAELRTRLRDADASFRVVKNSLTERAADQAGAGELKALLEGPTAFTFVRGDAALAAKALSDFSRTTPVTFKGGLLNGEGMSAEQIVAIGRLPTREVLYGQLVGTVASPITGLVRGLAGLISGLARQLQQIAEQGLVAGEAPAAAAAAEGAEPAEPETSIDAEAPTAAEEVASPVDEAPAEARPGPPDPDAEPHDAPVQPDQAEGDDDDPAQIEQDPAGVPAEQSDET
jgi:large subunit ribosomal protein L10